jgi:hypothetical protein
MVNTAAGSYLEVSNVLGQLAASMTALSGPIATQGLGQRSIRIIGRLQALRWAVANKA